MLARDAELGRFAERIFEAIGEPVGHGIAEHQNVAGRRFSPARRRRRPGEVGGRSALLVSRLRALGGEWAEEIVPAKPLGLRRYRPDQFDSNTDGRGSDQERNDKPLTAQAFSSHLGTDWASGDPCRRAVP